MAGYRVIDLNASNRDYQYLTTYGYPVDNSIAAHSIPVLVCARHTWDLEQGLTGRAFLQTLSNVTKRSSSARSICEWIGSTLTLSYSHNNTVFTAWMHMCGKHSQMCIYEFFHKEARGVRVIKVKSSQWRGTAHGASLLPGLPPAC